MSGERPLPLWPEGLRKKLNLPPVENQRTTTPSRSDTFVVPKQRQGTTPPEQRGMGSGVQQTESRGEQAINAVLPSYIREMDSEDRDRISYKLVPDKEFLKEMGWDNFAELSLDLSSLLPKPQGPIITLDYETQRGNRWLSERLSANEWESSTIKELEAKGYSHQIPQFKEEMQEYRNAVKAIVRLQREQELL
jgi:hypothetical protein